MREGMRKALVAVGMLVLVAGSAAGQQSCSNARCPAGSECRVVQNKVECYQPCDGVQCPLGSECRVDPQLGRDCYQIVDPCATVRSGHGKECKVDSNGAAACVGDDVRRDAVALRGECGVDSATGKGGCVTFDPCASQPCGPNERCVAEAEAVPDDALPAVPMRGPWGAGSAAQRRSCGRTTSGSGAAGRSRSDALRRRTP
eukprot:Sspe_Gene.49788::Locus_27128_Transcript_10_11_Confidence_0.262_Length_864::g.49788::m.49788